MSVGRVAPAAPVVAPLPSSLPSAEDVPIPPELETEMPPPPSARGPAAPGRAEAGGDHGWLYQVAVSGEWTPASFERLTALFVDPPDRDTWSMALWAIERCPEPGAVDVLVRFAQGRAATRERALATAALGGLQHSRALPALRSLLFEQEEVIRVAAARAVLARATWDPEARTLLDEMTSDPHLRGLLDVEGGSSALADR